MRFFAAALGVALTWMLLPNDAFAWGPLGHADWTLRALAALGATGAPIARLLARHTRDFLYGALAADIIVGKNLARYEDHVHNWQVGFRVLREAEKQGEQRHVFALGMLGHLAADTVAHNYYVPYKTVESFGIRGTRHGYWEMRLDATRSHDTWEAVRQLRRSEHREHDRLLQEQYRGQVLPFSVNSRIFGGVLGSVRSRRYRQAVDFGLRKKDELLLTPKQQEEVARMSTDAVVDLMLRLDAARCVEADPTGLRNLRAARDLRRQLTEGVKCGEIDLVEARRIASEARESFREAIHGPLELPRLAA